MTVDQILTELEGLGSEQSKKVLMRHGAKEPFFGVKIADLKKLIASLKKDMRKHPENYPGGLHQLAMELYATGNSDAMYMAGLMVDPGKVTRKDLQEWVEQAYWYMLSDYTVAGTAADSAYGWEMGLTWIESRNQFICSAGWATLAALCSVKPDEELDLDAYRTLIDRVVNTIHESKNRVRYSMNQFLIAVGSFVPELTSAAREAGKKIGLVEVDMGGTSCKVPVVEQYIDKVEAKGYIGKKKARAFC